jgi:hypothetical protein
MASSNHTEYFLTFHIKGLSVWHMATYDFILRCKLFKISKSVDGLLAFLFREPGILKVLKNSLK